MDSNDESSGPAPSLAERAWQSLRAGFEWFADTFRGHAHVREVRKGRE
ncbi:hypothetical protein [Halanaeroarchaeum sp. HSR-CO]|nr:hypothetical protein [Halanaeroarchaeum sp. HSR-CO]